MNTKVEFAEAKRHLEMARHVQEELAALRILCLHTARMDIAPDILQKRARRLISQFSI